MQSSSDFFFTSEKPQQNTYEHLCFYFFNYVAIRITRKAMTYFGYFFFIVFYFKNENASSLVVFPNNINWHKHENMSFAVI